jgi:hypothetical protein
MRSSAPSRHIQHCDVLRPSVVQLNHQLSERLWFAVDIPKVAFDPELLELFHQALSTLLLQLQDFCPSERRAQLLRLHLRLHLLHLRLVLRRLLLHLQLQLLHLLQHLLLLLHPLLHLLLHLLNHLRVNWKGKG